MNKPMPVLQTVRHAELTSNQRARIIALCSDAYEEDFDPYFARLGDAMHVLALMDGELVSHAAWVPRSLRVRGLPHALRCAYVEAVATPIALQRRGLGTLVLRAIPAQVIEYDIAALSPSEPVFHARSGWEMWLGPLFYQHDGKRVHCPGEEVMIHRLPNTPAALDLRAELETDWREGDVW